MHEGMLTPAEEVRSNLSDNVLSDRMKADGFSLSEVESKVVASTGGTDTPAAARIERLDQDEHTDQVSYVVTTCTPATDEESQVLERSVRINTPMPSRPRRRVRR